MLNMLDCSWISKIKCRIWMWQLSGLVSCDLHHGFQWIDRSSQNGGSWIPQNSEYYDYYVCRSHALGVSHIKQKTLGYNKHQGVVRHCLFVLWRNQPSPTPATKPCHTSARNDNTLASCTAFDGFNRPTPINRGRDIKLATERNENYCNPNECCKYSLLVEPPCVFVYVLFRNVKCAMKITCFEVKSAVPVVWTAFQMLLWKCQILGSIPNTLIPKHWGNTLEIHDSKLPIRKNQRHESEAFGDFGV